MTAANDLTLTDPQLRVLRALRRNGWPAELVAYLLSRNGAGPDDLAALTAAGLMEESDGRWRLTPAGKRELGRQGAGRWY